MPQIVALAGGGFSMEPDVPLLDDYILGRSRRPHPKICFLPTASGDAPDYVERFHATFAERDCLPMHLSLFDRTVDDLRQLLLAQDIVYVGGGNTANALAVWRAHGLDEVLREAWRAEVILCGVSAGAVCWFETGVTDSYGPQLGVLRGSLGLLPGSCCPHYDSDPARRPTYHRLVAEGLAPGIAGDDGVGFHFIGTELAHIVRSRPHAHAYRVESVEGRVRETELPTRLLEAK